MAIRCSLLGHDFGETEVEREREEDGNEVVETVREVETCARCGKEKLITENTNVTSLGRSAGGADEASADADDETETGEAGGDEPADSATDTAADETAADEERPAPDRSDEVTDDAEIIEETDAAEEARTDTAEDVVTDAESDPATDEDDAVILDEAEDVESSSEREHGEWPDSEDTGFTDDDVEPSAWPESEGEDRGYDAELDDESADVEFGGGLTPEAENVDVDAGETVGSDETVGGGSTSGESSFTSAGSAPAPDEPAETDSANTEFVCPECGYADSADRSSLRAGDICPECRHGYIAERER